jgi:acyl carrier protein
VNDKTDSLRTRLIGLVAQVIGSGAALADPAATAVQLSDLGVGSLKMVNLMLAIELEFDVTIPPGDITPENFHSIETIEAMLGRLLAASAG